MEMNNNLHIETLQVCALLTRWSLRYERKVERDLSNFKSLARMLCQENGLSFVQMVGKLNMGK